MTKRPSSVELLEATLADRLALAIVEARAERRGDAGGPDRRAEGDRAAGAPDEPALRAGRSRTRLEVASSPGTA